MQDNDTIVACLFALVLFTLVITLGIVQYNSNERAYEKGYADFFTTSQKMSYCYGPACETCK
jgi:hypothetical protein